MHRGCFVWTPTPPLSGRRTPRPGPARVCVRALLGRVGRAGLPGAFWFPAIPSWGLVLTFVRWLVTRKCRRRALWVQLPAVPGWGPLLALVGRVVPYQASRRALWVLFLAIPGSVLLLALMGWVVSSPIQRWSLLCPPAR